MRQSHFGNHGPYKSKGFLISKILQLGRHSDTLKGIGMTDLELTESSC